MLCSNCSRESLGTPWGKCTGMPMEKNCPQQRFYLLFLPSPFFPSENFASCYIRLWVRHSYFSLAPCHSIPEIKPTSVRVYKRKRHVPIHTISWAPSHIIKVIFNLPAFYQAMNHFYTDPPRLLCSGQRAFRVCGHQVPWITENSGKAVSKSNPYSWK